MSEAAPKFSAGEQVCLWVFTLFTIYTAWNGVSGWWAMLALLLAWGGGIMIGMVVYSRNEEDPEYRAFVESEKRGNVSRNAKRPA